MSCNFGGRVATYALLATMLSSSSPVPEVMNKGGVPYAISNTPGSTKHWTGKAGHYSTNFYENVKGTVEHFDVYGEVRTKYSQVYWTRNTPINLPPELVKRFDGKVMAITGYEIDQVTHEGPQPGSTTTDKALGGFACYPSCSGTDKSVPIYNQYNHHYFSWLTGKDAEMHDLQKPVRIPNPSRTAFRSNGNDFPSNIVFKENPGGEFRKSYHGYPSGYAQLVQSPNKWVVEPMQIDTHNRNYGINDEVGHKPWFLPKRFQNGSVTDLHNGLSPLIECPCSDRMNKKTVKSPLILTSGTCAAAIDAESACKAAIEALDVMVTGSAIVADATKPKGCSMVPDKVGQYRAVFNTVTSGKSCQ